MARQNRRKRYMFYLTLKLSLAVGEKYINNYSKSGTEEKSKKQQIKKGLPNSFIGTPLSLYAKKVKFIITGLTRKNMWNHA